MMNKYCVLISLLLAAPVAERSSDEPEATA